jgi:hypothetical protein
MCGGFDPIAILLEARNYWPRTERLLIGLHTTPRGGRFSFSVGERKLMIHFVVNRIAS